MITATIIDDEQNARDFLFKLLARYFEKKIINCLKVKYL